MLKEFRLDGAVALVTGGGSGIGRATAKALAAHGATVALTELPGKGHLAEELVSELRAEGREALALALDVRSPLVVEDVVHTVAERFGRLDTLVNNAGVMFAKPALEVTEAEWAEVLAVDLTGPFLCAQAAAGIMKEQGNGVIVNVASQHGVVGHRNRAPYAAAKGGLISLTRALSIEWAPWNIRVNSVSPTFVRAEATGHLFDAMKEVREEIETDLPLRRPAKPEDVAAGITYLVSPAAAMVTGHNLLIDGGWTAR